MEESITTSWSWNAVRRRAIEALATVTTCAYCGMDGSFGLGPDGKAWSIDHVVPRMKGGSDNPHNLVKCCHRCNCRKHTKLGGEWTPRRGTMTAAGIPWDSVHDLCFPGNLPRNLEARLGETTTEDVQVDRLERELKDAKARIYELERCIWNLRDALGNIEMVSRYAYGSVEITYNPSQESYK